MGFTTCGPVLLLLTVVWGLQNSCCQGLGTFGFDVHHRYSDTVKGILGLDGLPEKGSADYYAAMARRDLLIRRRQLTSTPAASPTPLTFSGGNETKEIDTLHYAYVNVGTPSLSFLVALDTGSDLFWLPCDCLSLYTCYYNNTWPGNARYSPETSSTSSKVPCNSYFCAGQQGEQCSSLGTCSYTISYASDGTSSSGFLVEDILQLIPDEGQSKVVTGARVPLGCGQNQTGIFLDGTAAPNGLFGLSFSNRSIPSVLARAGLTANSFSMCFGPDGMGKIVFGDTGSSGQRETPLNLDESYQFYNVTVSKVSVGNDVLSVTFDAIVDSGTSWTYLRDPAYTTITDSFNSQVTSARFTSVPPFEYCYFSEARVSFQSPKLNLTMIGGDMFSVTDATTASSMAGVYCLAVIQTQDVNIIGQNFMTGYNIVFDRGNQVLGWEASDCSGSSKSNGSSKSSAGSPISSPHNIPEAFAGILLIFLVYLAI